ncbi:MAG: acyl-CoA carboxylase subunit epsilon [Microbacterium sp.]
MDAAPDAGPPALRVDVLRGEPTPEELAAVIAVVTESYHREAASALAEDAPRLSAWQVSARALRPELRREIGWGRYAG